MHGFIRSVFLIFALGVSVSPGVASENRQLEIAKDGDYFGFDLRTVEDVTLDQCKASCIDDTTCRAFTYNPKVGWCFLKSDFLKMTPFKGSIAGKIVTLSNEPDIGAAPTPDFISDAMFENARLLKAGLEMPGEPKIGMEGWKASAKSQLAAGNGPGAVIDYRFALAISPEDSQLWLELARLELGGIYRETALLSALNGYLLTRTTQARAEALSLLAQILEKNQSYRAALNAYKASLNLVRSKYIEAAYLELKARHGFRVVNNSIDSDSANPRACVQFSEPLVKSGVDYASFVTLDGTTPNAIEAKDNQICVEGLTHGQRYKLTLRAGLPGSILDEPLDRPVDLSLYVVDRASTVRFTGDSFVLPSTMRRGIPLVSINATSAKLKLYRIGDRGIAPLLVSSQFLTQMNTYSAERIESESGQLVWQGSLDIQSVLNKEVVTSFPVDEALPGRKPGVYVLTAYSPDDKGNEYQDSGYRTFATQWFVVSDIGLTTYTGTDGLNVFARSLATAQPLSGVELQLLAKNNEILATATTNAEGRANFTAGLVRGTAAMTPAVITAKNGEKDYVFLDMTRAGFDLSDRGVTGRAAPGAIDILAWTERGIYRPGEVVHASALARDISGQAIENLPLTFIFYRPDGVEDRRMVGDGKAMGGYALDLKLQETAMRGTWTLRIHTDPKGNSIGEKSFLVDDFVPDRIEFDLSSQATGIEVGKPSNVFVDGRFLYGAPAAGLGLEGEVVIKPTRQSADYPGFFFGLADEQPGEDIRIPLEDLQPLDKNGKSTIEVNVKEVPSTTSLLNANITVRMKEAGGRAVERSLTLPIQPEGTRIGIRPEFSGDLAENSIGKFQVIATDPDGRKEALAGLNWKLLNVERDYQWYRDGSSWRYEPVTSTKQVADGSLDITADGAAISVPVTWGRYRLEIESPEVDGPTSSVEFEAGYYVEASSTETPDGLEIALDKQHYAVGDLAKLKVSPRFAGEILVTVGSESLITTKTASIGAAGGEIEIPVTSEWGAGAYVTATLFRPGEMKAGQRQESRMPMRAIGIKWLSVDPGDRNLAISLDVPQKSAPRQKLTIPIRVTGAGVNDIAYVSVAAVNVGILNLTRYEPPNPDGWYFGQRRLGLEIRDLYGRLIDGSLGAAGRLRTGGDGGEVALAGTPPVEKLVAFFAGPVKLDAAGSATVSFDIPQFNGTARIMAVAWSKTGVGHKTADVVLRDPVVVTASAPKFLAPGDASQMRIDIANTDGPSGQYQVAPTGSPEILLNQQERIRSINLDAGGKAEITVPLTGGSVGRGVVTIFLTHSSGLSLEQSLILPVRAPTLPLTERRVVPLAPNETVSINAQMVADRVLQGASVSLNVTRSPAFDIPALLMSLDRYPYGCTEQTT